MSELPANEPQCVDGDTHAVELVIEGRPRDLGSFSVRRTLPTLRRRLVGPFIFFDHMGPAELAPGHGVDVRPHPHIGLATVTYLFEGELVHRDSLGTEQTIQPGDLNWMVAGRGIVHSERSGATARQVGARLHGIQSWVALPDGREDCAPRFDHHDARTLPTVERDGARLRILAGEAYGARSPALVDSPTFYVDAQLAAGSGLALPDEYAERAAYIVEGTLACDGRSHAAGTLLVFRRGVAARMTAGTASRVMLLGGAPIGERHIWWNFVSSSRNRLEDAKQKWREGSFPRVPGDEEEFIPLPE
jgi:redox-sensitive bicupin YhaK (pirin superfamily)